MRILFLGLSTFIKNKLLGHLRAGDIFSEVAVASKSALPKSYASFPGISQFYADYEDAIERFSPDIVYISLINSLHTEWIEKSLNHGCHVVIDKPACLSLVDAKRMLDLAERKQRCLAEALVYESHTQIEQLRNEFIQADIEPHSIVSAFSFPSFIGDNFRNKGELGGGAVWDLGPYAVSIGRIVFQTPMQSVSAVLTSTHPRTGVNTGFTLLAAYPKGRAVVGHFGFDTEYRNSALVMGPGMNVEIDRIFTTPYDFGNTLKLQCSGVVSEKDVPPCNAPVMFLRDVVAAINDKAWGKYSEALLDDAVAMDSFCKALGI